MNRPRRNPMVAWTEIEDEIAAMSAETSTLHRLNSMAAFIWQRLNGENSVEAISLMVVEHFEVSPETARADLSELLSLLEAEKLVIDCDDGEPCAKRE